jgi:hypothetical protein
MKKVSRREAQRVRATPLHQDRGRPGAINAPNPANPPQRKARSTRYRDSAGLVWAMARSLPPVAHPAIGAPH